MKTGGYDFRLKIESLFFIFYFLVKLSLYFTNRYDASPKNEIKTGHTFDLCGTRKCKKKLMKLTFAKSFTCLEANI